jgi:hypothetical protein
MLEDEPEEKKILVVKGVAEDVVPVVAPAIVTLEMENPLCEVILAVVLSVEEAPLPKVVLMLFSKHPVARNTLVAKVMEIKMRFFILVATHTLGKPGWKSYFLGLR